MNTSLQQCTVTYLAGCDDLTSFFCKHCIVASAKKPSIFPIIINDLVDNLNCQTKFTEKIIVAFALRDLEVFTQSDRI